MALFSFIAPVEPAPLLRGDGLYLRPAVNADYSAWANLRAASRQFLTPWEPLWPDDELTRAAFRRKVRRQIEEIARDESFSFLIFDSAANALLGGITLGVIRRGVSQSATLGYWMGEKHAGKGVMTKSVAAVAGFGFGRLGLHRIEAACIPGNVASQALLERNGFMREGLAQSYLCINGAWRDHILYARVNGGAA